MNKIIFAFRVISPAVMKHILFICLFVIGFSFNGFSQSDSAWTLQRCIDRALEYNIQVKLSQLNAASNEVSVSQNKATFFPSINGSVSQNYFWGRSIDPYTNVYTNQEVRSNNFSLFGSLTIFEGLQLHNNLSQSKLLYLSAQN